jgi:hypothetical protein
VEGALRCFDRIFAGNLCRCVESWRDQAHERHSSVTSAKRVPDGVDLSPASTSIH